MPKYMPKYLLKGGKIATSVKGNDGVQTFYGDLLVEGTTMTKIEAVIDCTDKWITPGFIDTHRYLMTEYMIKMPWTVQPDITPDEVRIGTLAGCLDPLHNGVTTLLDHFQATMSPAHFDAALAASAPTRLYPAMEFGDDAAARARRLDRITRLGRETGGSLRADGRVTLGLAYDALISGAGGEAGAEAHRGFVVSAHALADAHITTWRDVGLLGPDLVFGHCNNLQGRPEAGDEVWKLLKESGAGIGATPLGELGTAQGYPVALEGTEHGVKCGLVVLQWQRRMHHADVRANKSPAPYKNKYNAGDVFRLGNLGGAEVLNMENIIGTIEVGKRADLIVFNANSPNLCGVEEPVVGAVFYASSEDVEMVLVRGEIVKKCGKLRWPEDRLEGEWKKWWDTNGPPF
ncbi:Metallo-dependent hydrolase [Epithele typhae]|uniref:Metallo-dependent hydrolase n=1 Tax=Epithele typhae TaxID=378194 RepID=UPI0020086D1B|nr:Metallo-dependent hydrolase [Epithele typhae]KAH9931732.1 Metallo-dependent hydrolase [Epithele typhae]